MGRLRLKRRQQQIKIKQKRKAKLAKLRRAYFKTKNEDARKKVLEKLQKVAPWLSKEALLPSKNLKKEKTK